MKTTVLGLLVLVSTSLSSMSQVTLNQGETYVFEFASLPLARVEPGVDLGGGYFSFELDRYFVGAPYRISWELFEDSTSETPFVTGFISSPGANNGSRRDLGNHWIEDHQGVARFTMEVGSVGLTEIKVNVSGPLDGGSHNVFEMTVVPVPEPGVVGLLGASLFGLGVWRFCRGRRGRA